MPSRIEEMERLRIQRDQLSAALRHSRSQVRHSSHTRVRAVQDIRLGVWYLTNGNEAAASAAHGEPISNKSRTPAPPVFRPPTWLSTTEANSAIKFWLEDVSRVAQLARLRAQEWQLLKWIETENDSHGRAPPFKDVYEQRKRIEESSSWRGLDPSHNHRHPHLWVRRFKRRWQIHRGILECKGNESAVRVSQQAWLLVWGQNPSTQVAPLSGTSN